MATLTQIQTLEIPEEASIRNDLIKYWTENALMEHASVGSFAKLSLELLGLGAPVNLLEGSFSAGNDEIRHAQITFTLASYYSGEGIAPGPISGILGSKISKTTLEKIAFESLIYGYIGEGISAKILREGAKNCKEKQLSDIYMELADDEEKHANLGWDIFTWAVSEEYKLGKTGIKKTFLRFSKIYAHEFFQDYLKKKTTIKHQEILSSYGIIDKAIEENIKNSVYDETWNKLNDLFQKDSYLQIQRNKL